MDKRSYLLDSFEFLKHLFTSASIFISANSNFQFNVEIDSDKFVLGYFLSLVSSKDNRFRSIAFLFKSFYIC